MFFYERIKSIKNADKVLEVGPGGTPFDRANEFLDIDPSKFKSKEEALMQRGSAPSLKTEKKITYYDGGAFPYEDNSFDYVVASHVLEHVEDVELFIKELHRIAKKGYIEYPTIAYEYLYNIPVHLTYLHYDNKSNTIKYMSKTKSSINDYAPIQKYLLDSLDKGYIDIVDNSKHVMFEGFEWTKTKPLKMKEVHSLSEIMPDFKPIKSLHKKSTTETPAIYTEANNKDDKTSTKDNMKISDIIRSSSKKLLAKARISSSLKNTDINFKAMRRNFAKLLDELETLGKEPFLMPFWNEVNKKVKLEFLPVPPANFLEIRAIRDTMFVDGSEDWLKTQIAYLRKNLNNYKNIVKEDLIGGPKLLPEPNNSTSHNNIHHLYHQVYFEKTANIDPSKINSIIEWGGGYGNFAKLWMRRFSKLNPKLSYTIIDSSLFIAIQWLYLSSILGKESVNIVTIDNPDIIEGKINLVPLAVLKKTKMSCDLFVSTWGLSESAKEAQDYVVSKRWFGAKHLLIGFQDSYSDLPYAERLGKLAKKDGADIIDIEFIPNNHYAIK